MKAKHKLTAIIMALFLGVASFADINTQVPVSAEAIAASGTYTSAAIDLTKVRGDNNSTQRPDGFFSAQVNVAGSGTVKVEYLLSNDGTNYVTPTGATEIATGLTAGNTMHSFDPMVARYLKIKVTETGGANAATVTVTLAIQ